MKFGGVDAWYVAQATMSSTATCHMTIAITAADSLGNAWHPLSLSKKADPTKKCARRVSCQCCTNLSSICLFV